MADQHGQNEGLAELRRLYSELHADRKGPSDEALTALLLGELDGKERASVTEQLLTSPDAAERYRLLKELHAAARPVRRISRGYLAALAACLAVAVSLIALWPQDVQLPVVRGEAEGATPSGWEMLESVPREFTWDVDALNGPYQLQVFSASGDLLWELSEIAEARHELSEEQSKLLADGDEFFWVVRSADGGQEGPYWFRVDNDAPP